jgi:hypothetical protein
MRMYGPNSKEVMLLSAFIGRRVNRSRPLDIPLPELTSPTHHLYAFMQFMKAQDCIHVLNLYLSLGKQFINFTLHQWVGGGAWILLGILSAS